MSDPKRRDFLAAAGSVSLAALPAAGGDPSFMNNVPDPALAGKDLPTFKFALEKSDGKVIGGSYGKEATVAQLPISKGIAGVSMRLEPGAMRELHWHATAAEWAFVLEGRVRTTVVDPAGFSETNDFDPGDVWYFPRGHGHMLQCLGDQPCRFILIFDNGYFSEFGTFSITDWIGHTPPALLAKNFGLPEATFANFPKEEKCILRVASRRRPSLRCRCRAGGCHRRLTNTACWRSSHMGSIAAAASGAWIPAAFRLRRRSRAWCWISIQAHCERCTGIRTPMSGNTSSKGK
jgi:oxalate decarboxylase family bicupin protein